MLPSAAFDRLQIKSPGSPRIGYSERDEEFQKETRKVDMTTLEVQPGDVIGVPAKKNSEWGFVIARVIRRDVVTWIEVFSDFYKNFAISENEVLQKNFCATNRLFNPVYASLDFNRHFGKTKWSILAKTPQYDPEQSKISEIEFEGTFYAESGNYLKGGEEYQEPPNIRRELESRTIYSNPQLVHHINLYLSGCVPKGRIWTVHLERSIIENKGMDWWLEGIRACKISAEEIARRFQETRKDHKAVTNSDEHQNSNEPERNSYYPFILSDERLILSDDKMESRNHIFEERSDEGWTGNGNDWGSVAQVIVEERLPELASDLSYDSEAGMLCVIGPHSSLEKLAEVMLSVFYDDDALRDFLSRAQLD